MYTLTIIEKVPNPNFASQLEEHNNQSRYARVQVPYPDAELTTKHLEVSLTEEQFKAVKRAALEVF